MFDLQIENLHVAFFDIPKGQKYLREHHTSPLIMSFIHSTLVDSSNMSFTVPTTDGRCNEKRENGKDMQGDVRIASICSLGKENEFFIHCNFFGGKGFNFWKV